MRIDKLVLIFTLVFVLLLHPAQAISSIEISSPAQGAVYNVGGSAAITGQITVDKNIAGATVTFSAASSRLNKTVPIATKYYSFSANTPATFSQINKGTLTWSIPFETAPSDDWRIYVTVDKNFEKIVDFTSVKFTVSKSLAITVSSNTRFLNLGETIEASGTVLDAKSNPIAGTANVTLSHSVLGSVSSKTVEIKDGFIDFSYILKSSDPPGNYSLVFRVADRSGNTGLRAISGIVVSDKLKINCTLPKEYFIPGDEFDVIGNLNDIHDRPAEGIPIKAYLTFPTQPISLSFDSKTDGNGNFAVNIKLPQLAEPGAYSVSVVAEDISGNTGACYKSFAITAQKDVMVGLNLNSSSYFATTEAGFELNIENNGNIDLSGRVSILVDNKEVTTFDFAAKRGEDRTLTHPWPVSVSPGEHTVSALLITSDGKVLTQTIPKTFAVYPHPGKPKEYKLTPKMAFALAGIIFVLIYLYIRRKDIRDYLWHRELRAKYGIGHRRDLPHFKKKREE